MIPFHCQHRYMLWVLLEILIPLKILDLVAPLAARVASESSRTNFPRVNRRHVRLCLVSYSQRWQS